MPNNTYDSVVCAIGEFLLRVNNNNETNKETLLMCMPCPAANETSLLTRAQLPIACRDWDFGTVAFFFMIVLMLCACLSSCGNTRNDGCIPISV